MRTHRLKEIVSAQKNGTPKGIYSACTANQYVLEALFERELTGNDPVLIEATANQVNQFGGYTGMKPADFKEFVLSIAQRTGFPANRIILGGDHLGPLTWQKEHSEAAMVKAVELVRDYVLAGFTKIHLDTSMRLLDDPYDRPLETRIIAERGARLAKACEEAFAELRKNDPLALEPVYIVGSEVPIPGGSQEEEAGIKVTEVKAFHDTVAQFKEAFISLGLKHAWDNVVGVVVQPGVEFGDETIHEYNRSMARDLCNAAKHEPGIVLEGHSTDYQTPQALKEMVEDGIAILKVGPALTFALREGLFALNYMENELFRFNSDIQLSNFMLILDDVMAKHPENWRKHYHGNKIRLARKFSLLDRCRYYLPMREVQEAIDQMLANLRTTIIPMTLISEFMPIQYDKIRKGLLRNDPVALLKDRVINCIDQYHDAAVPSSPYLLNQVM